MRAETRTKNLMTLLGWQGGTVHDGLHNFMATQIIESIRFDCDGSYGTKPTPRLTGEQWATEETARLNKEIAYHEKEHAEEVERAAIRTAWVRALRASL